MTGVHPWLCFYGVEPCIEAAFVGEVLTFSVSDSGLPVRLLSILIDELRRTLAAFEIVGTLFWTLPVSFTPVLNYLAICRIFLSLGRNK